MNWLALPVVAILLAGLNYAFYRKTRRFLTRFLPKTLPALPWLFLGMNGPFFFIVGILIQGKRLHNVSQATLQWVVYPFYAWMTMLVVVLLLVAPKDLLVGIWKGLAWIWRKARGNPSPSTTGLGLALSRRGFLSGAAALVPPLVYGLSLKGMYSGHDLEISPEVEIPVPGLPHAFDGLRITQISDLHTGAYIRERELDQMVEAANRLRGDLLVITGDILDSSLEMLPVAQAAILRLRAPLGVYGILGNHDYYADRRGPGYPGCMQIMRGMAEAGIHMLRNTHAIIPVNNERLVLAGVDWTGLQRGNPNSYDSPATRRALDQAFAGAPEGLSRILLAHHPHVFLDVPAYSVALTLAGHTHGGGQIVVAERNGHPIALGSPIFRYFSGLYRENGLSLYVNRGIGYVGLPIRLNCPPEISRFKLVVG